MKIEEDKLPSVNQLTRFRCDYNSKRINEITVKDKKNFLQWIENNKINKEKLNDLFVVNYRLEKDNFISVLSSIILLNNAKEEGQFEKGFVCIDTTYKLTTCRFPLAILSTRDKSRKLMNIGFAILSNEKKIVLYFM